MAAFSLKTFRLFIRERGLGLNKRRLNSHKRKRKYDHGITHSIVSFENYQTAYTYFCTTHCQTMMLAIFNFSIFCSQYRNAAYIHTPQHWLILTLHFALFWWGQIWWNCPLCHHLWSQWLLLQTWPVTYQMMVKRRRNWLTYDSQTQFWNFRASNHATIIILNIGLCYIVDACRPVWQCCTLSVRSEIN